MSECVRLPHDFWRYPTEGGQLHGEINIDLGEWFVEGRVRRFHMRIRAAEIPKIIHKIISLPHHEANVLGGAVSVFRVAE